MRTTYTTFAVALATVIGVMSWHDAGAATMTVAGPPTVAYGQTFSVQVLVNSNAETVNALEATLTYDPDIVAPVSIIPDDGFIELWTELPSVVRPGTIAFSGGTPDGALVVDAPVVTVLFKALKNGIASINLDAVRSGMYLNDGFGTKAELTIRPLTTFIGGPLNLLSQPRSSSHPDQAAWLPQRTLTVSWDLITDVEVSYRLSKNPFDEPEDHPSVNAGSIEYPNLGDGVWYFTFIERQRGGPWSQTFRYLVLIDGTPPDLFSADLTRTGADGPSLLSFHTSDTASGIAYYRVSVTEWTWWMPWRTNVRTVRTSGPLELASVESVRSVTVAAVDRGGNERVIRWNGTRHARQQLLLAGILVLLAAVLSAILLAVVHITYSVRRSFQRRRA